MPVLDPIDRAPVHAVDPGDIYTTFTPSQSHVGLRYLSILRHKGIGAEIMSAVAERWRLQHQAWVVQHPSVGKAVLELKTQTAMLAEILELLRSRTR
jgi:hypothetical protein